MIKVLFVCHGNICRSPMAEFIFKKMVSDKGLEDEFHVASAATSTEEIWNGIGNPVYPPAKNELKKHGMNCEGKRAVQLKKSDYEEYDYIIAMDSNNLRGIERITGHRGGKISLLLSYNGEMGEISDPWYTNDFHKTYIDIERGCKALMEFLTNKEIQK